MARFGAFFSVSCFLLAAVAPAAEPTFPYQSKAFERFVSRSYDVRGGKTEGFYRYMDSRTKAVLGTSFSAALAKETISLKRARGPAKAKAEEDAARWAHKLVKKTITKFSLDRGFEFAFTEKYGERQCFLQSVLIVSMLQKMGLNAGVAMVNSNEKGQASFNGHAVAVLHQSDGRDRLVDASEPYPFAVHQGLFLRDKAGRYAYVAPSYAAGDPAILKYKDLRSGRSAAPKSFQCLGVPFLDSMFDYYRGERVPSGLLNPKATMSGLAASKAFLERSVKDSSANPLAWAMLGRVCSRLGLADRAKSAYAKAYALGKADGWIAPSVLQQAGR
jgi:hypothetical protein